MSEDFFRALAGRRQLIDEALRTNLPVSSLAGTSRLNEALDYAVFPGGKRLRPVLAVLASELAGARRAQGLAVACAVEFLHSSSLILDDLPCMDDADLRRNRRALHLAYGEGVAVLAAVALLNKAYALLAEAARASREPAALDGLMTEVARCVGADGMVGGQAIDLELRAGSGDAATVACRDLKTVALTRLVMSAGALACGAIEDARALAEFGECFGRAYQVCDDLLDGVGGGPAATGKPAHQDVRHARATNVDAMGVARARRLAAQLVERGLARLDDRFGEREEVSLLAEAAALVLRRAGVALSSGRERLAARVVGSQKKAAGIFHT